MLVGEEVRALTSYSIAAMGMGSEGSAASRDLYVETMPNGGGAVDVVILSATQEELRWILKFVVVVGIGDAASVI